MSAIFNVRLDVHPDEVIAPVSRRIFGSFVEHMGRCVYSGIFEPGHPTADDDGFRADVLELTRELGVTAIRYPGGNFVSGYHWEDGIGPRADRPARLDFAWHSRETNAFGLDEFVRWTRKAQVEPVMTLNLGTRGVSEAIELLEYVNHSAGSARADQRIANGGLDPYDIRAWCLGNELDGPWQLGHKTAHEYARLAAETARAMRQFDPDLELVVCGSSSPTMPTFGAWEETVLDATVELVDHISLHAYYEELDDISSFLASGVEMERAIERVAGIADAAAVRVGKTQPIGLAIDEWNVWYLRRHQERFHPDGWPEAPRLCEDAYTVADAVVVGSLLISFLKHADRVRSANLSQLVNVIAPIKTVPGGPAWREATFYPFSLTAAHARGDVLRLGIHAPLLQIDRLGEVLVLDAVATLDEANLCLFVVNRHARDEAAVSVDLRAFGEAVAASGECSALVLSNADPHVTNTLADPDRVRPVPLRDVGIQAGRLSAVLPAVSWSMIRVPLVR